MPLLSLSSLRLQSLQTYSSRTTLSACERTTSLVLRRHMNGKIMARPWTLDVLDSVINGILLFRVLVKKWYLCKSFTTYTARLLGCLIEKRERFDSFTSDHSFCLNDLLVILYGLLENYDKCVLHISWKDADARVFKKNKQLNELLHFLYRSA